MEDIKHIATIKTFFGQTQVKYPVQTLASVSNAPLPQGYWKNENYTSRYIPLKTFVTDNNAPLPK
jgi:hypothetical protein